MEEQLFTVQIYTPNSDLAAGVRPRQFIAGRTGNDTLVGYQPTTANPGQFQIDIFNGDLTIEDPASRQWSDTFILGDWQQAYYANGNPDTYGLNDFGLITDFNSTQDFIELNGNADNYQLLDVGVGAAILQQQQTGPDVVGFLLGNSNLSLESNYFNFQGFTPPPGPVVPQTQQLGSSGFDLSVATATDPLGNVYIAGGTTGSLGGPNNGPARDAFVAKYDSQGNQLLTKQIGISDLDTISDIATDDQGNFYVAGITAGDLGGIKQGDSTDAFVAKYDSNGDQQWIEQFGQNVIFQSFGIDVDDNGNAYVSGIDVESSANVITDDFWVSKFDTNGNQQWFTETGIPDEFDESYDVTVGSDGSVYATGWTLSDLAGENAGLYDNHLAKYDNSTGQLEWIEQYGTSDYEWSWGVDTDSQGNVYTTGWSLGDLAGTGNLGSYDAYLTKYDSQGNPLWIQQFGTSDDDEAFDIFIDSSDNIFLTGYTNGNLGGLNAGSFDTWAARYDTDGNQVWLQQFGTPDFEQGYGITSDDAGNLYLTGVTGGSLGDTNAGSFDSWLAKLDAVSGSLLDFSGVPDLFNTSPSLVSLGNNAGDRQLADQQMIDFIDNFFREYVSSVTISSDGYGLTDFGLNPLPQPTSIPDPTSGVGILMFAAFSCLSAMFKTRRKKEVVINSLIE